MAFKIDGTRYELTVTEVTEDVEFPESKPAVAQTPPLTQSTEEREENTGVKNAAVSPIPDTFSSGQRFVDLSVHLESRVNHPDIVPLTALRGKLDFGIITMREDEPSPTSQLRNHFWATGIPNGRSADLCLRSASRIKNF